ncbi:BamA/TamA family outer membrane protein [Limibacter armeniacum]|uniref:translocation and assembly module lipoprotein TamL n=1 Tax=Limibacter armeniacum TaxID=466084 RepID=UPI002FE586F8
MSLKIRLNVFAIFLILLFGCNPSKYLAENENFYNGATIEYNVPDSIIVTNDVKGELEGSLTPSPNSQLFGKRVGVYYHFKAEEKKKGIPKWMGKKFGEKPVLYDELITNKLVRLLENKLNNNGYYGAQVTASKEVNEKEKEVNVIYKVTIDQQPYTIRSIAFPYSDSTSLQKTVYALQEYSLLWEGERYSLQKLRDEAEHIDDELKNLGYYYFNPKYLEFLVDSTVGNRQMDVELKIRPSITDKAFKQYRIGDIVVEPDFDLDSLNVSKNHTTLELEEFTYRGNPRNMRPSVLEDLIQFHEGDLYSREKQQKTIKLLTGMGAFRFVDLKLKERDDSTQVLDARLRMSQVTQKSLQFELGMAYWDNGFIGPEFNVTWKHKNLFGGGEVFSVKGNLGVQTEYGKSDATVDRLLIYGLETRLTVPRLMVPFKVNWQKGKYIPFTNFLVSMQRYDFSLPPTDQFDNPSLKIDYFNASFGYDWRTSEKIRHQINPVVIGFQNASDTSAIADLSETFPFLGQTFRPQFIVGSDYSFTYNSAPEIENINKFFFRGSIDVSGNLLYLLQGGDSPNHDPETNPYRLFSYPYSQYIRLGTDFRYFWQLTKKSKIGARLYTGLGFPIGNSTTMPFVKQYFVGGPNSIRAFRTRTLGPGSYSVDPSDEANSDSFALHSGDIKLESSLEYRYDLHKYLKWALFVDAGNIWLKNADSSRPGGEFNKSTFLNDLAIGGGTGFRIDAAGFFILRFDFALPFKVPYNIDPISGGPIDHQWVIKDFDWNWFTENLVVNVAIGYPF